MEGRTAPVDPRDAATVILLRDDRVGDGAGGSAGAGVLAYMLRRAASMAFAPGAYVFPGGGVDPRDRDREVGWAGPSPREWGETLNAEPAAARALVCAAVRETFEESGVLLAGPTSDSVVDDTRDDSWEADRQALLDRSQSLAEFLQRRGLVLRSDLLRPWARWVTPVIEPRRYDTRFFVAAMPAGQRTRDVGGEADTVAWVRPAEALAAWRAREMMLLPPTAVTLNEVGACGSVGASLDADRTGAMAPRMPGIDKVGDKLWLTAPEGVDYPL
ncbi:MAG: NUDIX hydrolase [Streptosporangiales bacterium]|nr:NUDIX hydrolase [Streptosporangiales bacterium]